MDRHPANSHDVIGGTSITYINQALGWSFFEFLNSAEFDAYNSIWVTESFLDRSHVLKSFVGGAFITICMTGLDQDMMQKLELSQFKDAKNMLVFSSTGYRDRTFYVVGALLFIYAKREGIAIPLMDGAPKTDLLFLKYFNSSLGLGVAITFILGLIAAAYSSTDDALTSLTTVCVDFYPWKNDRKRNKKSLEKTHGRYSLVCGNSL